MRVIVATAEPHLRSAIAADFESAPYFLAVDTVANRTTVLVHPVQFQAAFTPTCLIQRLRHFDPETVVAGGFGAEVHLAASALRLTLKVAQGRAAEAVDELAGSLLPRYTD